MNIRASASVSVSAVACVLGLPAFAQDIAGPVVEEIVVTATKRSENVQDIPIAVTAISGDAMTAQGIGSLQGIAQQVPSINWGEHFGTTLVSIRGVGSIVDSGVTEPTVALYVDGVFLPRSTMATLRAVDLERVEILRGPQGTLYGRNATGGAVNFISKAPSDTFTAGVDLSTGSRDAWGASGYISAPLAEGVKFRLSGGHEEQDGYVRVNGKRLLGGTDVTYVRGALRLEPTSDVAIDLTARYEKNKAPNAYQQFFGPALVAAPSQFTTEPYEMLANKPFAQEVKTFVGAATINWDITDTIALKSTTSYVDHKSRAVVDSDGSAADFNNVPAEDGGFYRPSESYGQELNLSGSEGAVKWLVGAFAFHEDADSSLPVNMGTFGGPLNGLPPNTLLEQAVKSETKAWALYGDVTWALVERVRLNLGLRYNKEKQEFVQHFGIPAIGVGPFDIPLKDSGDKLLPKVGMQFDLAESAMAYVQWSKGFKSGGVNLPGGGGENLGPLVGFYQPEQIDAYEAGLKSELFDRRVTWNSAAFYYDYKDLQVTKNVPPAVTTVDNANAKIYGFETELLWRVTDNFKLNSAVTLLHSRFESYTTLDSATGIIEDLDGTPVPHSPDYTLNAGGDYRFDLGGDLLNSLTVGGNVYYTDDVVLRQFEGPENIQKGYALVNLSASLADRGDKTHLSVFVNNVGDKEYKQHVINFGIGYMGNYGPPRTWGLRLSRDF